MRNLAIPIQSRASRPHAKRIEIEALIPRKLAERMTAIAQKGAVNVNSPEGMSRSESIVPVLIDYIKTNRLVTGDKMPTEVELSAAFGVSTRSVREALVTLKTMGVVEARQGVGWHIGKFDLATNIPIVLGPLLQHFNEANILEVFEARLCVEPFVAGLAAKKITHDRLEQLNQALEVMRKNAGVNGDDFRAADRKFHDIVTNTSGNHVLSLISLILSGVFWPVVVNLPAVQYARVVTEHEEIYRKLMAGDADGAALAASIHIEEAIKLLRREGLLEKIVD
jgi:GntR family transcriptional regulator, transcriptional repressor for pyruvate dehydrogenase complex